MVLYGVRCFIDTIIVKEKNNTVQYREEQIVATVTLVTGFDTIKRKTM